MRNSNYESPDDRHERLRGSEDYGIPNIKEIFDAFSRAFGGKKMPDPDKAKQIRRKGE
jgi:hypothetical protein